MKIFDLEQEIMRCWAVVDDIDSLYKLIGDSEEFASMSKLDAGLEDKLLNILLGLKNLYDMKFQQCFHTFEEFTKEHHKYRIQAEDLEKRLASQIDWEHRKQTR